MKTQFLGLHITYSLNYIKINKMPMLLLIQIMFP